MDDRGITVVIFKNQLVLGTDSVFLKADGRSGNYMRNGMIRNMLTGFF